MALKHAMRNVSMHLIVRTPIKYFFYYTNIFPEDYSIPQTRRSSSFSLSFLLVKVGTVTVIPTLTRPCTCCEVATAVIKYYPIVLASDITCAVSTWEFSENVYF